MIHLDVARSDATARAPTGDADRPLTVVHAVAPAPFGGLETVLRSLAAGMDARGHATHIAAVNTPDSIPHPFVEALHSDGRSVHEFVLSTRDYRAERRRIRELCLSVGADVLHTHGYRPDVMDSGIARSLGIPRVSTVHGFCGGNWKGRLYEWMQIRAYRGFDGVIAVAQPQVERLEAAGVSRDRIHLLPNAWAPGSRLTAAAAREALSIDADAFHIGWVGRLSDEKGPDLFLKSLAGLADIPFIASVIGDGRARDTLRSLAIELGIGDRIRWHGSLPDAGRYFEAFDAFALSSRTEGTPMVMFEAMASGTPIVAAAVGGVPHMVSPAEALLVPAGDTTAFGQALRAVHDDRTGAATRAAAARTRLATDFGTDGWLDRHEALYRRLIASHAR